MVETHVSPLETLMKPWRIVLGNLRFHVVWLPGLLQPHAFELHLRFPFAEVAVSLPLTDEMPPESLTVQLQLGLVQRPPLLLADARSLGFPTKQHRLDSNRITSRMNVKRNLQDLLLSRQLPDDHLLLLE